MHKFFVAALTFVSVISLTLSACSGKGDAVNVDTLPAEVADKAELESYECNADVIGEKVYVKDLKMNYECDGEDWFESNSKNEPESSSANSSSSMRDPDENSVSSEGDESSEQSSSSDIYIEISSSSEVSSSSVVMAVPCKTETEDNCEYGSLYDPRDGRTYKTVKIGEQWWMAENLRLDTNYTDADSCYAGGKWYDCAKYGKFYEWSPYYNPSSDYGNAVRACPVGWDLPYNRDWETLLAAVGGAENAGKVLKSTSGWSDGGNGTDAFGFSALPGGYVDVDDAAWHRSSPFDRVGTIEIFWSQTCETKRDSYTTYYYPYRLILDKEFEKADLKSGDLAANYRYHVRCVCKECQNEQYSSLATRVAPCKSESEDNCEYGTLVDNRDGRTYKTVKIGEQWWMAENLNFEVEWSACLDRSDINCLQYGRLYTRGAAMDSAGQFSPNSIGCGDTYDDIDCSPIYPARGICPEGWHLPDKTEWNILISAVGGSSVAGLMLKSTSGWNPGENGIDAYSFSALPSSTDKYGSSLVIFWTSMEGQSVYDLFSMNGGNYAYINVLLTNVVFVTNEWNPIRCLKDPE